MSADVRQAKSRPPKRPYCLECKARRVKCDMQKPSCVRCTNRKRECHWGPAPEANRASTGEILLRPLCATSTTASVVNLPDCSATRSGIDLESTPETCGSSGTTTSFREHIDEAELSVSNWNTAALELLLESTTSTCQLSRTSTSHSYVRDTFSEIPDCNDETTEYTNVSKDYRLFAGVQLDRSYIYTSSFYNCWLTKHMNRPSDWISAFSKASSNPLLSSAIELLGASIADPEQVPLEYQKCIRLLSPQVMQVDNKKDKIVLRATISLLAGLELFHGTRTTFAHHLRAAVALLRDRPMYTDGFVAELDYLTWWSCIEMETLYKFLVQERPDATWEQLTSCKRKLSLLRQEADL